jgi:serine-type D-Ala-D-Ala carboxypeptidase (penicillin-binding protein 5/6)
MEEMERQQNTESEIANGASVETIADDNFERHMPVIEQLGIAFGILVLIFGTTLIPDALKKIERSTVLSAEEKPLHSETVSETRRAIDPFKDMALEARSAYVWDVKEQRILYSKSPDERLPLASLSKLMTALVAHELLGNDATVSISFDAIAQEGDSGFGVGELFTSRNLLDLTLVNSSNDGAYALAAAAGASIETRDGDMVTFVEAMNIRAKELGLTQTSFRNPTGLDVSGSTPGAVGSARDMAFLMEYLVTNYPETLEITRTSQARIGNNLGLLHDAENTNRIAASISGLLGSKTGYTDLAGGNLVIAFDAGLNHPIIVSVLGSTREGRFKDVEKLVEAAKAAVSTEQTMDTDPDKD